MSDKPAKSRNARLIVTAFALFLTLGVGWEIYSGVAIHKTGGPSYRALNPNFYWFEMIFQGAFTAVVVWFAYRAWRSR